MASVPPPLERALRRLGTTPGQLCWAALTVVVVSGVALGALYDPGAPLASVELLQEGLPFGWLIRATHLVSAQAFLVLLLLHTVDHVVAGTHRDLGTGAWWWLVLVVVLSFGAMFGGFVLRGDAEARSAHAIAVSVTRILPGVGEGLSAFLWGRDGLSTVYLHHLVTFTLLPWLLAIRHGRRAWAGWLVTAAALVIFTLVGLVYHPGPGGAEPALGASLLGPWYFVGLQELLRGGPSWLVAWILPGVVVLTLGALGHLPPRGATHAFARTERGVQVGLLALTIAYGVMTVIGFVGGGGR